MTFLRKLQATWARLTVTLSKNGDRVSESYFLHPSAILKDIILNVKFVKMTAKLATKIVNSMTVAKWVIVNAVIDLIIHRLPQCHT